MMADVVQVWEGDGKEPEDIRLERLRWQGEMDAIRDRDEKRAYYVPRPPPELEGFLAYCPICKRLVPMEEIARRRSQVTQYFNEESNWSTECFECWEWSESCWQEQMDEYHASIR